MLVKDYELNFTFEISDEFNEISKDKYKVFGVDDDTLHYFLYLDENNEEYPLALIKGKECANIEDYEKTIQAEVDQFKKEIPSAVVSDIFTIEPEDGRRVERVSIDYQDGGFMTVVYFTYVGGHVVSASTSILEDADDYEAGLYKIMQSIKEME